MRSQGFALACGGAPWNRHRSTQNDAETNCVTSRKVHRQARAQRVRRICHSTAPERSLSCLALQLESQRPTSGMPCLRPCKYPPMGDPLMTPRQSVVRCRRRFLAERRCKLVLHDTGQGRMVRALDNSDGQPATIIRPNSSYIVRASTPCVPGLFCVPCRRTADRRRGQPEHCCTNKCSQNLTPPPQPKCVGCGLDTSTYQVLDVKQSEFGSDQDAASRKRSPK